VTNLKTGNQHTCVAQYTWVEQTSESRGVSNFSR